MVGQILSALSWISLEASLRQCSKMQFLGAFAERAANSVKQACEAGALQFLTVGILKSVPFEDEFPFQKELYVQALHQLLMTFLDAEPGRCDIVMPNPSLLYESNNR